MPAYQYAHQLKAGDMVDMHHVFEHLIHRAGALVHTEDLAESDGVLWMVEKVDASELFGGTIVFLNDKRRVSLVAPPATMFFPVHYNAIERYGPIIDVVLMDEDELHDDDPDPQHMLACQLYEEADTDKHD